MNERICVAHGRACQFGVTLVELMVALAVVGILAAVGIPSLRQFHDRAAINAQYETLNSALRRARSEAMARGELVTVCALDGDSLATGTPECLGSGKAWHEGWLVFIDRAERGEVDENDWIVSVHQPPANSGSVLGTQRYLTYRASGVLLSLAAHFRFVPPGQPAVDQDVPGSVMVCVNKTGKPRVAKEGTCG
jgi:type IV fimbrial biogenesis protein FimT